MILSRGLILSRLVLGIGRRPLNVPYIRSISSSTRCKNLSISTPLHFKATALSSRAYTRHQMLRAGFVLQPSSGMRFKSTVPLTQSSASVDNPSTTSTSSSGLTSPSSDFQLNDALEFSSATIENIPEHIGYLKSIGINYGFGPTGFVEWILEHIHVLCGTPWWASIALTAIAFRIIFFKAFIGASDNAAKMSTISHITKPLQQKMSEASRAGDTQRALMHRQELQLVYKRAGIKLWKSMAPLLQGLIGYGTFVLIRAMSNLPVPGLETGGVLWFTNLTIPDPYFILPLATAGILHLVLRKGGETGATTLSDSAMRKLAYAFPAVSLIFTWWLPAGLQWSFLITTILSQFQGRLLRWGPFRQYMGIAPLPERPNPFSTPKLEPYKSRIVIVEDNAGKPETTGTSSGADIFRTPQPKPTLFSGISKEINSAVEAVKSTKDSIKALNRDRSKNGKRTKAEIQAANAHEEKRQREEAKRLASIDAERRARRLQRRDQDR